MSDTHLPERIEKEAESSGLFGRWFIRITVGIIVILIIAAVIAYITYLDVKSERSQPLEISAFRGMQLVVDQEQAPGRGYQQFQGLYENLDDTLIAEIENHYRRQMDSCEKLYDIGMEEIGQFHTIVCEKNRAHDFFGFTQFARVGIQPERNIETNELTGWVIVTIDHRWEE